MGAKGNQQWDWVGWMLAHHGDGLSSSSFIDWSSIAQSVCQRTLRLLAIWCPRPWVRILHSAEEDNLSTFDSKITCLCQSIEIKSSQHLDIDIFNSLRPRDTYMHQWTMPSLVHTMACRLVGAKPLSDSMLRYGQFEPQEQFSAEFSVKFIYFHSGKCIWKCRLWNDCHFVQGEMGWWYSLKL